MAKIENISHQVCCATIIQRENKLKIENLIDYYPQVI